MKLCLAAHKNSDETAEWEAVVAEDMEAVVKEGMEAVVMGRGALRVVMAKEASRVVMAKDHWGAMMVKEAFAGLEAIWEEEVMEEDTGAEVATMVEVAIMVEPLQAILVVDIRSVTAHCPQFHSACSIWPTQKPSDIAHPVTSTAGYTALWHDSIDHCMTMSVIQSQIKLPKY